MRRIMRSIAVALVLAALMLATMAIPAFAQGPPPFRPGPPPQAQGPPEGTVSIMGCAAHGVAVETPAGTTVGPCAGP